MSVKIMSLVWEHAPYTAGSLLVLLALADWANDDGIAWPSMERLAKKVRIDRRSAQRIVRQLEKDGILEIEQGGGRAKQHKYLLKVETATNCRPLGTAEKGDISDTKRATFETQRATSDAETATPTSPDPLEEPSDQPSVEPSENSPPFSGSEFSSALADFEQHRKEKRIKVTPTARRLMFRKFESWGEERSTAALIYSTEKGYTGCFEERANGSNQPKYESATERNSRNLRENAAYIRSLSNDDSAADREDPIGLLASSF